MSGEPIPPTPARRPVPPRTAPGQPPSPKPPAAPAAPAAKTAQPSVPPGVRPPAARTPTTRTPGAAPTAAPAPAPGVTPTATAAPPANAPGSSPASPVKSAAPAVIPADDANAEIIAKPATYYRATRYIMFALLVGMGAWFSYDGWVGYPRENARFDQLDHQSTDLLAQIERAKRDGNVLETQRLEAVSGGVAVEQRQVKRHQNMDLIFQKLLGVSLPIIGILTLAWALHTSRGVYRLKDDTLMVPGHPEIPLDKVLGVDTALWERKGIAYIQYDVTGIRRRLKLDDYIYERGPTDAIYNKLQEFLASRG